MPERPWSYDQAGQSQAERKPSGAILVNLHDGLGFRYAADTRQCPHCSMHFVSVKGSGHIRGYCFRCGAVTCGQRKCDVCVPWERKMELAEAAERGRILLPGQW